MAIIILIPATLLIVAWLILLGRVTHDDIAFAVHAKYLDKIIAGIKLKEKDKWVREKLKKHEAVTFVILKFLVFRDPKRKLLKLEREVKALQQGSKRSLNPLVMPGYVLLREVQAIAKGSIHKAIMSKCFELYGKKNAPIKTKQLLAKLLSYPILGVAGTLTLGVMLFGSDNRSIGVAVIGIGTILILVLVYAMYDELGDMVRKRQRSISREFPNVVSKLALLVTSGMIMDRAWKETSYSGETEIYQEMRKTSQELDNLVSPEAAYSNFINRCNTKESAKLASAIMQNLSKGNAQIGKLLKDMAREAWQERRHGAKRDAEKANSKLMIPTMLLFLAILVMLMVPVAMNFTGI
ncbi:MAG: type II secretion system F family protein [Oscillospiraceae bacterium]|nr:type II secretion system F family protein [Oscillospiraceae bacterium]MCL2278883.1 type II secretion system F family protein [Oscillospiraceae bacterium]